MKQAAQIKTHASRIETTVWLESLNQSLPIALLIWPTIKSYTGQPSVEVHTVGNLQLLELIIRKLNDAGVRSAQPGEFTYRAFLNGRLDLTQCEAVLSVIHSTSQRALDRSLRQLAGGLSQPLMSLRRELINLLADLEAGLDFVDEDIEFITLEQIQSRLNESLDTLENLEKQLGTRRVNRIRPKVVLVGMPNAGKSSLINCLTKSETALVSNQAGTTRDFLTAILNTQHGEIELVDTAGIEQYFSAASQSFESIQDGKSVDELAQLATAEALKDADLILLCHDCQESETSLLQIRNQIDELRSRVEAPTVEFWRITTKTDLAVSSRTDLATFDKAIATSVQNVPGLELLRSELADWLLRFQAKDSDVVPMTLVRCAESIIRTREAISNALALTHAPRNLSQRPKYDADDEDFLSSTSELPAEVIAAEIRNALADLGTVVGAVYTDDILDALFSRFCIGK